MNTRTTLVLAVVALLVAGIWGYTEYQKHVEAGKARTPVESVAKALYEAKPADVDKVELTTRSGKDTFVFKKQADKTWQMVSPTTAPANDYEVNSMVDRLAEIKFVKAFDKGDKDRPSDTVSGIARPNATLKLYTGDKQQAGLVVGNKVPTGVGTYVQKPGEDTIYQANSDVIPSFQKRVDALRNKQVIKFELKDVTSVKAEGMTNYQLSQSGGTWVIESPTRGRGDKEQVEKVVRPISSLYVQDFKDDDPISLRPYQLDRPRVKVTVTTTQSIPPKARPGDPNTQPADTQPSSETREHVLLVGGPIDSASSAYFAKLGSAPWIFTIPETTVKELTGPVSGLRDKQIARFENAGEVIRIEAMTPGGSMTLSRNDKGEWTLPDGRSADPAAVDDLVKTVQNLKATDFTDPNDKLTQFDWNKPRGRVIVTRRGVAEPITLLVGNPTASGQMVYVKNAAEDSVAAVRKAEADQLLASPMSYQDRAVLKFPRDQAVRIEVARADKPAVTLAKVGDKWSMTSPVQADADADAARNLVADLSNLRAKRVADSTNVKEYGLDAPMVKLVVHTEVPPPRPAASRPAPAVMPATLPSAGTPVMVASQPSGAANAPAAARSSRRETFEKMTPEQRAKEVTKLQTLLDYNRSHPNEAKPEVTAIIEADIQELQKLGAVASQPTIQGAPQGPAETQPAASQPAPKPEIKIYRVALAKKGDAAYAMVEGQPQIYEIDLKIYEDAIAELHDRQVLKFEVADVRQIGFEQGASQVVLNKSGDDWKYAADPLVPIDNQKVTEVINVFRDLKALRYEVYDKADPAKYGLAKDVQKMWVVLTDGQRSEVVVSGTGPINDADKSRYAMKTGTPSVFLLKGDQAGKFAQKLEDFEKSANAAPAPGPGAGPGGPPGAVVQ